MTIQVEVCVQDCYTLPESIEEDTKEVVSPPSSHAIPADTWENWFGSWINLLQPDLSPIKAYELSLRLTSNRDMQSLNAQYRQQDKPTDVLAFAALESDYPQTDELQALPLYLGDIVISIDTAERQATAAGHSLEIELAWLASHGLLHLLGYDHPDEASLVHMLTQQKALLNTVGLLMGDS